MAIYRLFRVLTRMEAGRWCRSCGNAIEPKEDLADPIKTDPGHQVA